MQGRVDLYDKVKLRHGDEPKALMEPTEGSIKLCLQTAT